jgi:S-adenosylmethionine-diacylglycerol 3-amino-3-carboxypropyl transferase
MGDDSAQKELEFWRDGKLGKTGRSGSSSGSIGKDRPAVLFGQVREDAEVEVSLFRSIKSKAKQNVFAIASGGCTALSLATVKECKVMAVDINPAQIYLCLLKTAALTRLSFGEAQLAMIQNASAYFDRVAELLPAEAREYFLQDRSLLSGGLNNCGVTDSRIKQLMSLFFLSVHTKEQTRQFLSLPTLQVQQQQFAKMWKNWQWDFALSVVLSKTFLSLGFGNEAIDKLPKNFSAIMKARIERALNEVPVFNNGYVWQAFLAEYPRGEKGEALETSLPPYLQAKNQKQLKENLPRVLFSVDDAVGWLEEQKDNSIDMFALSNILELVKSDYGIKLAEQVSRTARPGALICLRSIFPKDEPVLRDLNGKLKYMPELSAEMEAKDRSCFCNFIQVYQKA